MNSFCVRNAREYGKRVTWIVEISKVHSAVMRSHPVVETRGNIREPSVVGCRVQNSHLLISKLTSVTTVVGQHCRTRVTLATHSLLSAVYTVLTDWLTDRTNGLLVALATSSSPYPLFSSPPYLFSSLSLSSRSCGQYHRTDSHSDPRGLEVTRDGMTTTREEGCAVCVHLM